MCSRKGKKGQIFTVDLVISISIFILLIAISYSFWVSQVDKVGNYQILLRAQSTAIRTLDSIILSPGHPSNWDTRFSSVTDSGLKALGGASSPYVLDWNKLDSIASFYNSSSSVNGTKLKLGISPYEADIRVVYFNGTEAFRMGSPPNSSSIVYVSASRQATLNGDAVWVRVRVWELKE